MKNSKQEAIEKAYQELGFTGLYNQADSNGWVNVKPQQFTEDIFDRLKFNSNKHSIRPKSLKGIETNNGWIRIESEEDLPTENTHCFFMDKNKGVVIAEYLTRKNGGSIDYVLENATHYQPILLPNPPIY